MSGLALRAVPATEDGQQTLSRADALLDLRRRLTVQAPAREVAPPLPTSVAALDAALAGGLPRGKLVEIAGGAGKLAFALLSLAAATQRGELCALIDVEDALDIEAATRVGVTLDRLLWVRPRAADGERPPEQVSGQGRDDALGDGLKALDLVLAAGGFGLVVLYLGGAATGCRRNPMPGGTWSRLVQRAEKAGAAVLIVSDDAVSGSFSVATLRCVAGDAVWQRVPGGRWLLQGQQTAIEVARSRLSAPGDAVALRLRR